MLFTRDILGPLCKSGSIKDARTRGNLRQWISELRQPATACRSSTTTRRLKGSVGLRRPRATDYALR
eukprot:6213755-Pleurochrysis_carterae.AAC.4